MYIPTSSDQSLLFLLTMQILSDVYMSKYEHVLFHSAQDKPCLYGVRLYEPGICILPHYVYIAKSQDLKAQAAMGPDQRWILVGETQFSQYPKDCTVLVIAEEQELIPVLNLAQETFETYHRWDRLLHRALDMEHPLTEMLKASVPIFQNPIFVHDTNFYIMAWSHRAPGMLVWDQDPRTGWNIVPLSLINDFRVDADYLNTLKTRTPSLYPAEQRGYPILYVNLWNENHYEGRICVDELETPILPGQYHAIGYLARVILHHLKNSGLFRLSKRNDLTRFFINYLDGAIQDSGQILNYLYFLNWNQHDRYLCLRLETNHPDTQLLSSAATLGHIETQIPEGHALLYRNGFSVVINLSTSHAQASDVVTRLSLLMREGLLEMGVSAEIHDFLQLPQAHLQASVALDLGRSSPSMTWSHYFDDYLLEFLLQKGQESLPAELLCSNKLLILRQYDEKNNTDLYHTLKVYLELERNVLQTAKTLFIHRSTLFYRLERMEKIAGIQLEDARERLILRISFYILENS